MPTAIIGLGEARAGRPVPVVSPLIEFGSALHVLRDPGHHGATGWAAGIGAKMSPRLAAWTRAWWWTAQAIRAAPFVTTASPADDFQGSLGRLRAIPASRLASQLLRPVSRSGDARAALHWSRSREPAVAAVTWRLEDHEMPGVPCRRAGDGHLVSTGSETTRSADGHRQAKGRAGHPHERCRPPDDQPLKHAWMPLPDLTDDLFDLYCRRRPI
jgi:Family of unknown function (DUF5937)